MNVLITGGTGFIGSRLAEQCLTYGERVRVLGQTNTPAEAEAGERLARRGADVILGSVLDRRIVEDAAAGVDLVYHLAAAQHEAGVPDGWFWDVNVEGTATVLEASIHAGVRRLVHGSTIGVYGAASGALLDEQSPTRPDNIYGITKLEAERLVRRSDARLPVVVVRISETYGPGDRRLLKLFRAIQRGAFVMIGRGVNRHHPVYVDDVIEGLRLAAVTPSARGGLFLLAGPEVLTTAQMADVVARQLGRRRAARLRLPLAPVSLLAAGVEVGARAAGRRPVLHRRRIDFFTKSFALSLQRSKDVLGFIPQVGFESGVAATLAWYRERGELDRTRVVARPRAPRQAPPQRARPLTAQIEPFDSFWEAPADLEKGYRSFGRFYRHNYLRHLPQDRQARILVVSSGPGYFVNVLREEGYQRLLGIDSDPEKVAYATRHGLPCRVAEAFPFIEARPGTYDTIVCEQELNHLTKPEILEFLGLCRASLRAGGTLIVHGLNGANPITGAEALAQNFDHYNTFTEYTLRQVLGHAGFEDVRVIPLSLYVFWTNPLNYLLLSVSALYTLFFRLSFMLYGKSNRVFTKKIGAICRKAMSAPGATDHGTPAA
jgi:nucleoside-diphosphate-sugar epimerase/2-polyprenyl-3-methyl-5-hydroxy-6-metoxy-1,4-benzoquinol methylase